MKGSKTLLFIFGLFAHICTSENTEATKLTQQGHSVNGNDKKVTKREYYAPEYNHERYSYPAYRFEYGVHDPQTGDIKKQYEERDGDSVRGYYSLMESDGSIRLVEYTADAKNGFQAVVKKIGNSHHPMKVTYHMNTAAVKEDGGGGGGGGGSYAPNYHGDDIPNNNVHSLAPVLMHGTNQNNEQPPALTIQNNYEQPPAYANPHFEPSQPAYANPHFEPSQPAYANPHFEPPAYTNHPPQYVQHQQQQQPIYEPPAFDYDSRYQLQHHPPPATYNPFESQQDTYHYEPPLVPAHQGGHHGHHGHHGNHHREPEPAFPAPADYDHGSSPSPPPLFAGGLPTAHGDYGSASPDEYHPAPLQFPAVSRENDFGWPTAKGAEASADADAEDDDDDQLHRINLDDFQFPAAADFPAIDDDDDEHRRSHGPLSARGGSGRGGSAERPEYLRKYFEPDYRGNDGGGANSFYADDYNEDGSNK